MLDQTSVDRVLAFTDFIMGAVNFHNFKFGLPDTQTNEVPVVVPLHDLVNHETRLLLVFDWPVQVVSSQGVPDWQASSSFASLGPRDDFNLPSDWVETLSLLRAARHFFVFLAHNLFLIDLFFLARLLVAVGGVVLQVCINFSINDL